MKMQSKIKHIDDFCVKIIFKNTIGARPYPPAKVIKKEFLSDKGRDAIREIQATQGSWK